MSAEDQRVHDAAAVVAFATGLDLNQGAPLAGGGLALGLADGGVLASTVGQHDAGAGGVGGGDHLVGVGGLGGDGLFDDDALDAGGDGVEEGLQPVLVVAVDGNDGDVGGLGGQHVAVVGVAGGGAGFLEPVVPVVVGRVGEGDGLDVRAAVEGAVEAVGGSAAVAGAVGDDDGSEVRHWASVG